MAVYAVFAGIERSLATNSSDTEVPEDSVTIQDFVSKEHAKMLMQKLEVALANHSFPTWTRCQALSVLVLLAQAANATDAVLKLLLKLIENPTTDLDLQTRAAVEMRRLLQILGKQHPLVDEIYERLDVASQDSRPQSQHRALSLISVLSDVMDTQDALSRIVQLFADPDVSVRKRAMQMVMNGDFSETIKEKLSPALQRALASPSRKKAIDVAEKLPDTIVEENEDEEEEEREKQAPEERQESTTEEEEFEPFDTGTLTELREWDYTASTSVTDLPVSARRRTMIVEGSTHLAKARAIRSSLSSADNFDGLSFTEALGGQTEEAPVQDLLTSTGDEDPLNLNYLKSNRFASIAARYDESLVMQGDIVEVLRRRSTALSLTSMGTEDISPLNLQHKRLHSLSEAPSMAELSPREAASAEGDTSSMVTTKARIKSMAIGSFSAVSRRKSRVSARASQRQQSLLLSSIALSEHNEGTSWDEDPDEDTPTIELGEEQLKELGLETDLPVIDSKQIEKISLNQMQEVLREALKDTVNQSEVMMGQLMHKLEEPLPTGAARLRADVKSKQHSIGVLVNLILSVGALDNIMVATMKRLRVVYMGFSEQSHSLRRKLFEWIDDLTFRSTDPGESRAKAFVYSFCAQSFV